MDRETELELIRRLGERDPGAFDAIYAEYRVPVFNFLARLSHSRDVADDLSEETWLRLVANGGRLRPDTRLGAWLYTVARNLYFSHCRSRLLADTNSTGLLGLWPAGVQQPSPFDEVVAGEFERRVDRALAMLPIRYREVMLLVGIEGLSHAEAAAVCGLTAETLRQRLSRGRSMLARALDPPGLNQVQLSSGVIA
jgi:RNA polymerase sigma-70 factor (ECF subfamily)